MATESGSERLCCNPMRQSLCLHWCPNFGKCDERSCAKLTLSNLVTQATAPDAPTHEQVVNKQWIIRNNAVSALKESWRQPLKVTNDSSEPVTVSLRPPRSKGLTSPSARDIALWAKGSSLLRHQYRIPTRKEVAVAVVRYHHRHRQRHRQCHRHSNRHLQNVIWNKQPK